MSGTGAAAARRPENERGLVVERLSKAYPSRSRGRQAAVPALTDVSFRLLPGESLGIVGESGSGKSTIAACVAGLIAPTSGSIRLDGRDIAGSATGRRNPAHGRIQMVFQNSSGSLNPRRHVGHSVGLPLICAGQPNVERRVDELLERVGLRPSDAGRYPHEFSGGQRQRLNIARALALNPDIIICDEPTSGLDVSIQAQICELFLDVARQDQTSYIFISHDLAVVQMMTGRLLVVNQGSIVEELNSADLLRATNPYTRALIEAIPGNGS